MTILTRPINSASAVADIVRRFEDAIMAGEILPGERIREQTVAREMGVSRGVVREALRQLEGRKLVERIVNVGARIAVTSENQLVELFQIWQELGGLAARLAASRATLSEARELQKIVDGYATVNGNRQKNFNIHSNFHRKVIALSRSESLELMLTQVLDVVRLQRFRLMTAPDFFERAVVATAEEQAVVDGIAARDAVVAESAMRTHLHNTMRYQLECVK